MSHTKTDLENEDYHVMVESYSVNERMNQVVLEHLEAAAWRAQLPGSKGRTIAAIVAHMHNARRKWLRLSAPHLELPAPLQRSSCTQKQARAALAESGARCAEMIAEALAGRQSRVEGFRRDGWTKAWPAGVSMMAYMIAHDTHHRGQVCMLAHQLGYPLPVKATAEMWTWEKLWKQCGFTHPR
jgi:uncharacterized damage-inducible protein DinB